MSDSLQIKFRKPLSPKTNGDAILNENKLISHQSDP